MFNEVKDKLRQHLEKIAIPRDPYFAIGGHFFVREYIREELSTLGEVEVHKFAVEGKIYQNLILNLPVNKNIENKPLILIGAHYDAVPNTSGADDNATGVAVLLELARYFRTNFAHYPLRIVAFDLEEYGLQGSTSYAKFLRKENQSLRLMISLEMLGYTSETQSYPSFLDKIYPATGNFIALVGNLVTIPEMIRMSRRIDKKIPCQWLSAGFKGYIVPDTRRSDHAPFWDQGYKALMVTDTANLRNPYYHKSSDTIDTLNLDFLTGVCEGLKSAIAHI